MIYAYKCACGYTEDVWKPIEECGTVEICSNCNLTMGRVWSTNAFINTRADTKAKYNDKTGKRLIEVGNEREAINKLKPETNYDFSPKEMQEMGRELNA